MRYMTLDEAIKPAELVAAAYKVRANTTDATVAAAAETLLAANPALRDAKRIAKGTLVLVPDRTDLPQATSTEPVAVPPSGSGILTDAQIARLGQRVQELAHAEAESAARTAQVLRSADVKRLILEESPDAEKQLAAIMTDAKRRAEEAAAQAKRFTKVLAAIESDMQKLRKRFT